MPRDSVPIKKKPLFLSGRSSVFLFRILFAELGARVDFPESPVYSPHMDRRVYLSRSHGNNSRTVRLQILSNGVLLHLDNERVYCDFRRELSLRETNDPVQSINRNAVRPA